MYSILDEQDYKKQIEDILYDVNEGGYCVIVNGIWYNENGDEPKARKEEIQKKFDVERYDEAEDDNLEDNLVDKVSIQSTTSVEDSGLVRRKCESNRYIVKEAIVGDQILYDLRLCTVIEKKIVRQSFRLIVKYDDGTVDNVVNDWNRYVVIESGKNTYMHLSRAKSEIQKKIKPKRTRKAKVGDWVVRTSDNLIGKVVEMKKSGSGLEWLILELKDGSLSRVYNKTSLYDVIKRA